MTHTNKQWDYHVHTGTIRDENGKIILKTPPVTWSGVEGYQPSDIVENATLASAAPQLYIALPNVMTWIENWSPEFTEDEEWGETENFINQTLNQAKP